MPQESRPAVMVWFACSRAARGGLHIRLDPLEGDAWSASAELDRPSTEVTGEPTTTVLTVVGPDVHTALRVIQHELGRWRRG